jgi:hypothetical protein
MTIFDDTRKQPTDASQYWSDPPASIDWQAIAVKQSKANADYLAVISQLRSDLSATRFERDIWWPLAWCVGVLCGVGMWYVI